MKHLPILLLAGYCCAASGCSPLAPRPDYSQFFVLTPVSNVPAPALANVAADQLTIGIGPIDFPDYLKRLEVVTRNGDNQLDISTTAFWGEPLDKDFARILAENLAGTLNTGDIEMYPWPRRTPVDYQIVVAVDRFETNASRQSVLDARWIIKDGMTGKSLYASRTLATASAGAGDAGIAAALSEDLATLSRAITDQVSQLRQHREAAKLPPSA